jgi:hypothetical protein
MYRRILSSSAISRSMNEKKKKKKVLAKEFLQNYRS